MIRITLVVLFLLIFFILSLILLPFEWLAGKFNPAFKDRSSLRIVRRAFKIIKFISGVKTTVIGQENIPEDEPVLFVGNHNSYFDIVIAYTFMKRPTGFVAKKELNGFLFVRRWMRNLYCLFLDRKNLKEGLKTILTGIDYIKNGISIVIFPEGTRNKGDDVQEFHSGSFKLAEKSGCKIIPMVQNNTKSIFEKQFPRIKASHTVIEFGKPIDLNELSKEDRKNIAQYTHKIVSEIHEKNKSLVCK